MIKILLISLLSAGHLYLNKVKIIDEKGSAFEDVDVQHVDVGKEIEPTAKERKFFVVLEEESS